MLKSIISGTRKAERILDEMESLFNKGEYRSTIDLFQNTSNITSRILHKELKRRIDRYQLIDHIGLNLIDIAAPFFFINLGDTWSELYRNENDCNMLFQIMNCYNLVIYYSENNVNLAIALNNRAKLLYEYGYNNDAIYDIQLANQLCPNLTCIIESIKNNQIQIEDRISNELYFRILLVRNSANGFESQISNCRLKEKDYFEYINDITHS